MNHAQEPVIVEKKGKPVAVAISPEQDERIRQEEDWALIESVAEGNKDKAPAEVLREVTAVVEAVRQERYELQKQASKRGR